VEVPALLDATLTALEVAALTGAMLLAAAADGWVLTYPGARGPEPTMNPPPPELELVHTVAEGVTTLVTVPVFEYARLRDEADPVQVFLTTSVVTSEESCCRVGEVMVSEEPEARVTEKLLALTTIDWTAALEPDTSRV
jgi:hypothetical protein